MKAQKKADAKPGARISAPKDLAAQISPARRAAFDILLAVGRGQNHSDDLLHGKAVNGLSAPDRNLATTLVLGVLRWQIQIDHRLQAVLLRPYGKLDTEVVIALRLGAFQLLHLDRVPAYAAISESVELAKRTGHRFASGMVNAVLRKLSQAPPVHFSEESAAELALAYSHPALVVERWASFFGLETARAICRYDQDQPTLTIRIVSPGGEDELAHAGICLEPGELLTAARSVVSSDLASTAAFREGRVRLQDEGSQLVAELASGYSSQKAGSILDACAAPGGKTMLLAERNPAARILACEISFPRHEQMQKRLAYLGDRVQCRLANATELAEDSVFDLVLADVPCSGTGTLGRNPEIRHRLSLAALSRQAERQRAILAAALRAVRPGGRVIYSTCSLEPEENEQVVAAVLAATPKARLISLEGRIGELLADGILTPSGAERLRGSLTAEGCLRLRPGAFHTDGFFIAQIERTA
jgi:16S rRNA (cytosine967-C5)-methyltransferase